MRTTTAIRLLTSTLTAVTALVAAPSAAQASDERPCVSKVEFNGVKFASKDAIERAWEVEGLGWRDPVLGGWAYPRCGYATDKAWYALRWDWKKGYIEPTAYKVPGAQPHGHP